MSPSPLLSDCLLRLMPDASIPPPRIAKPLFGTVGVVGFGLMGSSFARAVRRAGAARSVIACDKSAAARRKIADLKLARAVVKSPELMGPVDLVMLATPLGEYESVFRKLSPALKKGTIVSDVGSVKAPVLGLKKLLPEPGLLVPGHPIAGTERSGPAAGFGELFTGRYCLLTPDADTDRGAVRRVGRLWRALGARVEEMSAEEHDRILSFTSHLPHAAAYALVHALRDIRGAGAEGDARYAAGGLRDFTRIAASDPVMWRDVFLANREQVLARLDEYAGVLGRLREAIDRGDGAAMERIFAETRGYRRSVERAGQAALDAPIVKGKK